VHLLLLFVGEVMDYFSCVSDALHFFCHADKRACIDDGC